MGIERPQVGVVVENQIGEEDSYPRYCEPSCRGNTDAVVRSGDDGDATGEVHIGWCGNRHRVSSSCRSRVGEYDPPVAGSSVMMAT
jgi:hypothetical protein